jgi:hypothetical protein
MSRLSYRVWLLGDMKFAIQLSLYPSNRYSQQHIPEGDGIKREREARIA